MSVRVAVIPSVLWGGVLPVRAITKRFLTDSYVDDFRVRSQYL